MSTTTTLGDLLTPARKRRAGGGSYPILSMTMKDGLVDQASKFKKRIASIDTSDYQVVNRGQLVVGFPIDEGVLSFQTLYPEAIVSPAYGVWDVRDSSLIHRSYLERYLRSPRAIEYYKAKLRGSTARRRSLPRDIFLAMPVPLLPIEEQEKVAAVLDASDALRSKSQQALAKLEVLAQAMYISMFGDPSNGREALTPLGDVVRARITRGIDQPGPDIDGGVPYIKTTDFGDQPPTRAALSCAAPEIASRFPASVVESGDIVMCIRATVGPTLLVTDELAGVNLSRGTARISPSEAVLPEYLFAAVNTNHFRYQIERRLRGATFLQIPLRELKELVVRVPPLPEQAKFVAARESLNGVTDLSVGQSRQIERLCASVQHRAFSSAL